MVSCGVCNRPREDHRELNHEFTLSNQLILKTNSSHPQWADKNTLMRLALVLYEKGVLAEDDLTYIFPHSGFDFRPSNNPRDL